MGYVFLAIVMAFSLTAAIYLWANDFNRETYPIIFPAIGAITLSVYLGIKIIWIDEHDPNQSKVTVAILHDRVAGQVLPVTGGLDLSAIRLNSCTAIGGSGRLHDISSIPD